MTPFATRSEASSVRILVAVDAILVAHTGKSQEVCVGCIAGIRDFLVAFCTRGRPVSTGQKKLGLGVIKSRRGCPPLNCMATITGSVQLTTMLIAMT
jgi:hypothetical protein